MYVTFCMTESHLLSSLAGVSAQSRGRWLIYMLDHDRMNAGSIVIDLDSRVLGTIHVFLGAVLELRHMLEFHL